MVFELLVADQPEREPTRTTRQLAVLALGRRGWTSTASRFPARDAARRPTSPSGDGGQARRLHPVQPVRPRLPRGPGQRRDRHGLSRPRRPRSSSISTTRWATVTCVACGECVQACPTGALMPATLLDDARPAATATPTARSTASAPIAASAARSPTTSRTTSCSSSSGRDGPANENRLCVKGRFGFDYVHHPHRLTKPLIRKEGVPKHADDRIDPAQPVDPFPRGELGGGAGRAPPQGLKRDPRPRRRRGAGRLRLGQVLERGGLSLPEAGAHRLRHQQRRPLHAAVPRLVGGGADGGHRHRRGDRTVHGGARTPT